MVEAFQLNQPPQEQNQPQEESPKENKVWSWIKNFLIFVLLIAIVVASFWVSFQLGRRILVPVRNPERKIEVAVPEPPPSIKALEDLEKVMSEESSVETPEVPAELPRVVAPSKPTIKRALGKHYFKVQAGLFVDREQALALGERVKASGFPVYIKKVETGWRVQVGAFRSREEAEALKKALSAKGFGSQILYE